MQVGRVLAPLVLVGLLAAPVARADTQDDLKLAQEGLGAVLEPRTGSKCLELNAGTAGLAETDLVRRAPDRGNGLRAGDAGDAPVGLPARVYFKTPAESFNRRYYFALRDGRLYFKSNVERTGIEQPWKRIALPACLDGHLTQIAADDDELIALDATRRVYTMDGALGDPLLFNWTSRWGPIFWTGYGWRLPRAIQTWAWSVLSRVDDRWWTDSAGNQHPVGDFKVSHIWTLSDGGRRLTFNDPWLPRDSSYEMCGPRRGRFRAANMAASGSTIFVIGRNGDMFTRLYDFDLSGDDPLFLRYSYEDQRGRRDPAIQLPSPDWVRQPKIRGSITNLITIDKTGPGSDHRTLRVEGRDASGAIGLWQKEITARAWRFVPTGLPLRGHRLANPRRDASGVGLAPSEDRAFVRSGADWRGALQNFNAYCSPAHLLVTLPGGASFRLLLHTVDTIRQQPRARGLDAHPRHLSGAIEIPPALLSELPRRDDATRAFIARYLHNARFTAVDVDATAQAIVLRQLGWRFGA